MPPIPLDQAGPSFEQVNHHVHALDIGSLSQVPRAWANPVELLGKIHEVYQAVRPILQIVAGSSMLPRRWRDALTALMDLLDVIPGVPNGTESA